GGDFGPGGGGQAAHLPVGDRPQFRVFGEVGGGADERPGDRVDRDPGEQQGDDLGASPRAGQHVDEHGGDHPAEEGRDDDRPVPQRGSAERDDEDRAHGGA